MMCSPPFPVLETIRQLLTVEHPTATVKSRERINRKGNFWLITLIDEKTAEIFSYVIDGDDGDFMSL